MVAVGMNGVAELRRFGAGTRIKGVVCSTNV